VRPRRAPPARLLAARGFFALFVLFLYGPMITIFVLSFQGPEGGLTFPMRGLSLHWFGRAVGGHRRGRHRRPPSPLAGARASW
jgi:putative spermidine/putrescine transport system permease protein